MSPTLLIGPPERQEFRGPPANLMVTAARGHGELPRMTLWHRLRALDHAFMAGGRGMRLDDAHLQTGWDELSPQHRVAVWHAARSGSPEDREVVHVWVAVLRARSDHERRWTRWYWALGAVVLLGLVWLTASVDDGLLFALPGVGVVFAHGYGRLRFQVQLERRRADLLAWLVDTRPATTTR